MPVAPCQNGDPQNKNKKVPLMFTVSDAAFVAMTMTPPLHCVARFFFHSNCETRFFNSGHEKQIQFVQFEEISDFE